MRVIHDDVVGIDTEKRRIKLAKQGELTYDRAVLSPGIDFMWDQVPALKSASPIEDPACLESRPANRGPAQATGRHMDGGTYALTIPKAPTAALPGRMNAPR